MVLLKTWYTMNALTYDYSEFIEILSKWDMVGMSLWMVVVYGVLEWMLCIVFWDLWYKGRKSPRLFSDVVVTTADRQRPLVGDISFIKTKLGSR